MIEFNTGRQYTKDGQRITAEIIDTKTCDIFGDLTHLVRMIDHSRGLDYLYELPELTSHEVMRAYDGDTQCLSCSQSKDGSYRRLRDFWKRDHRGQLESDDLTP